MNSFVEPVTEAQTESEHQGSSHEPREPESPSPKSVNPRRKRPLTFTRSRRLRLRTTANSKADGKPVCEYRGEDWFPSALGDQGSGRRRSSPKRRRWSLSQPFHGSPRCSAQEAQEDEEWGAALYETQKAQQGERHGRVGVVGF